MVTTWVISYNPNSSPIYKDRWNNPLIRSPLILTSNGTSKYSLSSNLRCPGSFKAEQSWYSTSLTTSAAQELHDSPVAQGFIMFKLFIHPRNLTVSSQSRTLGYVTLCVYTVYTNTPLKFNSSPLKSCLPNRKVVFQPHFAGVNC